jgi:FAD/FMN-containing dehydrogenase
MENKILEDLVGVAGKNGVLCTAEDLAVYSYDGTFAEGTPEVVVLPQTTEQTAAVVRIAAAAKSFNPWSDDYGRC